MSENEKKVNSRRSEKSSEIGAVIEEILKDKNIYKHQLAEGVGVSVSGMTKFLTNDVRFSTIKRALEYLGYEMVIQPRSHGDFVKLRTQNPCERCDIMAFNQRLVEMTNDYTKLMEYSGDK